MKIGIVCYPTYGGSGVVATELGKGLARKGHEVHFITYSEPVRLGNFSGNIFFHEVYVSEYPLFKYPPYELVLTSKLVDVAKHEGLDLFHVHYAIPHASAACMAQRILESEGFRVPVITTLHGTDITLVGKDASFEPVISYAMDSSNAVTAVSESLRNDTHRHFRLSDPIEVIPNFVEIARYPTEPDEELRKNYAPNGERILIHSSNFREVKRVEDIVRIFSQVREELPTKLLLIGDGPERHNIEALCREMGTCKDILFLGKLRNTEEVLPIADLFLLTSRTESFGLAALEAMASGVPVISTNAGGIPEVNEEGVSGSLSPVGAVDRMANNALRLLNDQELLRSFKAQARDRAEKFDIGRIMPLYEALYQRVLEKEPSV
ncbi:MAG: N-acetyl-alpha-D-glucosaminyl L-malate synthase BshA [Flavobacteriales bacterium]